MRTSCKGKKTNKTKGREGKGGKLEETFRPRGKTRLGEEHPCKDPLSKGLGDGRSILGRGQARGRAMFIKKPAAHVDVQNEKRKSPPQMAGKKEWHEIGKKARRRKDSRKGQPTEIDGVGGRGFRKAETKRHRRERRREGEKSSAQKASFLNPGRGKRKTPRFSGRILFGGERGGGD